MMPMNEHEYDALCARYGADHAVWPDEARQKGTLFLSSEDGQAFLRAEAELDGLLVQDIPVPGDDTAFLSRLMDIPETQAKGGESKAGGVLGWLFGDWSARAAFASQAAAYAIVLGMGVAMGMQGGSSEVEADSVDLSAHLFASNADLYLEDE